MTRLRTARSVSPAVVGYWLATALAAAMVLLTLIPSSPNDRPSPTAFSSGRALDHIAVIASEPHPVGSARNDEVRRYITSELRRLAVATEEQRIPIIDYYGEEGDAALAVNVVARIPGRASTGAVAVVGHYDSVPTTPGANDDASAVAIMLEIARVLSNEEARRNDVILVFTDGEEPAPRFGSTAFVESHRWADDIEFVMNLEAIGSSGPSVLTEVSGPDRWVVDQYLAGAQRPTAFSFVTATSASIGGSNTDFAPFRDAGIAGVELVYLHGSPIYHTAADRPGRVNLRSLDQHGANALGITRHVGDLDLTLPRDDSAVAFFSIGRSTIVDYPAGWNRIGVVAAGLALIVVALAPGERRRIGRSAGIVLGIAVSVAAVATVVWIVLAGWRNTMGIAESYVYLAVMLALAGGAQRETLRRVGVRWTHPTDGGVLVAWWAPAALAAVLVPSLSYVFVLPTLAGSIALVVRHRSGSEWIAWVTSTAAAATSLLLVVPFIDFFHQLAQPRPGNPDSQILATFAVPVLFGLLLGELLWCLRPRTSATPAVSTTVSDRAVTS